MSGHGRGGFFRRSESILILYFGYTAVLAQFLPLRPPVPALTLFLNLLIIGGFWLIAYADSLRGRELLSVLRDWYPAPLMLLAYREMGWFAPAEHNHALERTFEAWDKILLNEWGLKGAIEFFGPALPALLELAYLLVYTIPTFAVVMLYVYHRRERVDRFLFVFLVGILMVYAAFPLFPSEPPRTVFPGQDFPAYVTPPRRFNWWLLGGYGIHTSVFPSAHVSGAFSAAFGMLRILEERRWVGRFLLALAALIALGTVYGRYHYGADAAAGFAASLLAQAIAIRWEREQAIC